MQIVKVDKKAYSVGLWWQTLDQTGGLAKEARALVQSVNKTGSSYGCFALRKQQPVSQAGFGKGFHKTAPSLAAVVAGGQVDAWLGRFEFPDGVWILALVDNTILPNGDFFGTAEEADELLRDLEQMGGWPEPVAPVAEETESVLQELIRQGSSRGVCKLHPLKASIPWKPICIGAALLLVAGGGLGMYSKIQTRKAEEKRAIQLEEARKRIAAGQVVVLPWQQSPSPKAVLGACVEQMKGAALFSKGWDLTNWFCDGTQITTDWNRSEQGSFEDLPADGVLDVRDPKRLQITRKQPALEKRGEQKLDEEVASVARIYEISRQARGSVALNWAPPAVTKVGPDGQVIPPPAFKKHGWTLSSLPLLPRAFGEDLALVKGLVIQRVEWSSTDGWSIGGVVYVR